MQMDMILVDAHLVDPDVGEKFPEFPRDNGLQIGVDPIAQDFSAVPRDPHDVVLGLIHGMGLFEEFHRFILARCGEGSHPRPYGRGVPALLNPQPSLTVHLLATM